MRLRFFAKALVGLSLLTVAVATATADLVGPGSAAPKLQLKRWLKGSPVRDLEAGKTYVVEFWATWCGPCIESIPHVTELAKKNKDVTFIGVGIWEEDEGDKLDKFVANMGDKMAYNVAYSGNKDGMAASWMQAASQNGIPTAFIVKDRKVMWIGHPMSLDKPLEQVKDGTFDVAAFKKSFDQRAEATRKQMAVDKEFTDAIDLRDQGKPEDAKKALVKFVEKYPQYAAAADRVRYDWLADDDHAAWEAKTNNLLESGKEVDMQIVCSFALSRAQKKASADISRKAIAMALKANKKDDLTPLMYARTIYLKLGDNKDALATTTKMLEVLPNSPMKDNAQLKEALLKSKAELEAKLKG